MTHGQMDIVFTLVSAFLMTVIFMMQSPGALPRD
jgi:hypothetical protein